MTEPPGPPFQPEPPGPPPSAKREISWGAFIGGIFLIIPVSLLGSVVVMTGQTGWFQQWGPLILIAGIAFGLGTFLFMRADPAARGIGLGIMAGWAILSIVSAGFCTGFRSIGLV
jgi:hypothetical protein